MSRQEWVRWSLKRRTGQGGASTRLSPPGGRTEARVHKPSIDSRLTGRPRHSESTSSGAGTRGPRARTHGIATLLKRDYGVSPQEQQAKKLASRPILTLRPAVSNSNCSRSLRSPGSSPSVAPGPLSRGHFLDVSSMAKDPLVRLRGRDDVVDEADRVASVHSLHPGAERQQQQGSSQHGPDQRSAIGFCGDRPRRVIGEALLRCHRPCEPP